MKILKSLGIIILILIAAFLIVPVFLPHDVKISYEKLINAKQQVIFQQVNNLRNWKNWSPFEHDSTMVNTFEGPASGVGAKRIWSGKHAGQGTLEIVKSEPYKLIQNKLTFGAGKESATGTWIFDTTNHNVKVTWTLRINNLKYPFERWYGLMSKSVLQPMMREGLDSLETVSVLAEKELNKKMLAWSRNDIQVKELAAQPALTILDSTTMDGIDKMLERDYGLIMAYVKKKQIPIQGFPFAVYYNWNPEGTIVIRAGIPIAEAIKGHKEIKYFELPAGKVIFARHIGGFNTGPAHYAIGDYIKAYQIKNLKDYIWEVYVSGPSTETDSTKWETDIYYPLK